jgi:ribonuclease Z
MAMTLHILGCYAATPRAQTRPSAQVLDAGGQLFLIDCGEGTQLELRKHKIRFSRIDHIFISHLHGDHFFGLPGLLATFTLLGREKPLHIYAPKGLREAITLMLKLGDSWTKYPLHFYELSSKEPQDIIEINGVRVSTLPLDHRIYANGFLFQEQPAPRKLKAAVAQSYGIDKAYFRKIKAGADGIAADGQIIANSVLTEPPLPGVSYAYCSDTAYKPELATWLAGVHTLYHESTFREDARDLAEKTGHATAAQAAAIARDAGVKSLILGHYSTRYKDLGGFKLEAEAIFPNVLLADDGKVFSW